MTTQNRVRSADLPVLLFVGFTLRLAIWDRFPNIHWGDEIFQVTEPAHRLVFGTGIVAWEWLVGIRSWLLPGIFAGLMEIGRLFGSTEPWLINLPGAVMMAMLGCLPVFSGYRWGSNLYGRLGGLTAGFATCFWSDLLYMSPHTLNEVVAADLLILGLYLGYPGGQIAPGLSSFFWSGIVLGSTFACRFHLGPALLAAAIGICGTRGVAWRALSFGASIPVLGLGLLDWVTLSRPFQSIWLNFWYNVVENVSQSFGTDPWWVLILIVGLIWAPVLPVLLFTAWVGARRLPVLLVVSVVIFATHSAFAHKEYRFIYPAIPLLIALAGVGTAGLLDLLRHRVKSVARTDHLAALGILLWTGMSLLVATRPFMNPAWTREAGFFGTFDDINRMPQICGVASNISIATPGNTWLRPDIPLYQVALRGTPGAFARAAPSFNAIAANSTIDIMDRRYHRLGCNDGNVDAYGIVHARICLWLRPGGCDARAAPPPEPYWPDYFRRKMGLPPFDWGAAMRDGGP